MGIQSIMRYSPRNVIIDKSLLMRSILSILLINKLLSIITFFGLDGGCSDKPGLPSSLPLDVISGETHISLEFIIHSFG